MMFREKGVHGVGVDGYQPHNHGWMVVSSLARPGAGRFIQPAPTGDVGTGRTAKNKYRGSVRHNQTPS